MQAKYFIAMAHDVGDMQQSDYLYLIKLRNGRIAGYASEFEQIQCAVMPSAPKGWSN